MTATGNHAVRQRAAVCSQRVLSSRGIVQFVSSNAGTLPRRIWFIFRTLLGADYRCRGHLSVEPFGRLNDAHSSVAPSVCYFVRLVGYRRINQRAAKRGKRTSMPSPHLKRQYSRRSEIWQIEAVAARKRCSCGMHALRRPVDRSRDCTRLFGCWSRRTGAPGRKRDRPRVEFVNSACQQLDVFGVCIQSSICSPRIRSPPVEKSSPSGRSPLTALACARALQADVGTRKCDGSRHAASQLGVISRNS